MRLAASNPHSALFGFDSVNSFFHRFVSSRTDGNTFESLIKIQFSEYSSRVYRHSITAMRIDLTSRVARTTKKCFSFEFCPLPSLIWFRFNRSSVNIYIFLRVYVAMMRGDIFLKVFECYGRMMQISRILLIIQPSTIDISTPKSRNQT